MGVGTCFDLPSLRLTLAAQPASMLSGKSAVLARSVAAEARVVPEQLGLRYDDRWQRQQEWQQILEELRAIVTALGLKQVAFDLDVQPSQLSHALAERERHRVAAEWLPYFLSKAKNDRLARLLAGIAGYEVQPRRELTDREKVERFEAALAKLPDGIRRALMEDAFGPGAKP